MDKNNIKAAIVGSRSFTDYQALKKFIANICQENNLRIHTIISGGAKGADTLAEQYADEMGYAKTILPAEWAKYGRAAGHKRNIDIITLCDICFAFWDTKSPGTQHAITLCQKQNKPCYIYRYATPSIPTTPNNRYTLPDTDTIPQAAEPDDPYNTK